MTNLEIERIGRAFYLAFTSINLADGPGFLPHFPDGCCNWATYMVGNYLKFECGLDPKEASGTRIDEDGSGEHLWVDLQGFIIDLTCGQFTDCPFPFFLGNSSDWHDQWIMRKFDTIKPIIVYDSPTQTGRASASQIYERLVSKVRTELGYG